MKNINDLMNKITSNIDVSESYKQELVDKKERLTGINEELRQSIVMLEDIVHKIKVKKIFTNIVLFLIIAGIYTTLYLFTNYLDDDVIKVVGIILSLDLLIQLCGLFGKMIGNSTAKSYNYMDYYSLYQQYNILKMEIKKNNSKIGEIELNIDKEEIEISKLEEMVDSIDELLNKDTSTKARGTKKTLSSDEKYASIL